MRSLSLYVTDEFYKDDRYGRKYEQIADDRRVHRKTAEITTNRSRNQKDGCFSRPQTLSE